MKKIISKVFIIIISIIFCSSTFAQAPKGFNYQAVVRDAEGYVLSNKSVGFRISILQGEATVFTETHSERTNQFGLVSFQIGSGTVENSSFDDINWGLEACFLKVEMDPTGGTNYTVSGIEQLLSVPYALYAQSSGSGSSGGDGDPNNEIQDLQLIGNILSITGKTNPNYVDLEIFADNTDNQELQLTGNNLSITGGNTVSLPPETDPSFANSVSNNITDSGSGSIITDPERNDLINNSSLLNVIPGLVSAGKALVVDQNKDLLNLRNFNATGLVQFGNTIIIDGRGAEGTITETHGNISFDDENIFTTGMIGAGTNTPSAKLDVVGSFQYEDGNQGLGKILGSDANGNALWQNQVTGLPAQTGNAGKYLYTDGTAASWENVTKTTVGLANVENTALSTWSGSANLTTLGTVTTGTWQGTAVASGYIGNLPASQTTSGTFNVDRIPSLPASKISSGVFDNARINWGAPDAIGGTTAAAGNFTTLNTSDNTTLGDAAADAIVVKGALKVESGTPGVNKFLESDASGNASWGTITNTDITGLGTMSTQNKDAVDIDGGGIDGTTVGANTPALGKFSSLESTQNLTLPSTTTTTGIYYAGTVPFIHTYGTNNLFIGKLAGNFTTTGSNNTGFGSSALNKNTTGGYNTAVGNTALPNNTTGTGNTSIGHASLLNNTTGESNTAGGFDALAFNTDGDENTAFGRASLYSNTTGNHNIGIGFGANALNNTGSNNTIIGYQAGSGIVAHSKSGNVFVGYQAGFNETGDNKLYIENSNSTTPLVYGDFGTDRLRVNGTLEVLSTVKIEGGTPGLGKVLTSDASGNASWGSISEVPSQTGHGGKYLTTDGTDASWATITKSTVGLGNVENTALSTWAGTTNVTTLGTVATGTWQGTAINETYLGNLPASKTTSGTFNVDRIPALPASKVTSGTFNADRIPSLDASKITGGTFDNGRINWAAPSAIGGTTAAGANFSTLNTSGNTTIGDASADAVTVKGALKIESGTPGASKVLTSDASGNATWQVAAAGGATELTGLSDVSSSTKTSGNLLLADGTNFASKTLSGDATLASSGALTIANNSVDGTDIALGSDAQGDIMYYNGTNWVRLAAGTSGKLLQTNGSGSNPSWVNPPAGGSAGTAVIKNSNYTIQSSDVLVIATSGAGGYTYTLPSASTAGAGKTINVYATFDVTAKLKIARSGSDNIYGTDGKSYTVLELWSGILVSDGNNKWIVMD